MPHKAHSYYGFMVTAIASVAVNLPDTPPHSWDTATREVIEVSGEGADWEAAKAACVIPEDGRVLYWTRG